MDTEQGYWLLRQDIMDYVALGHAGVAGVLFVFDHSVPGSDMHAAIQIRSDSQCGLLLCYY